MNIFKRKIKVTIVMKSGQVIKLKADMFNVTRRGKDITSIEYKGCAPSILHLDMTKIAAILL